ncbi:MAG: hypothetical protein WC499_03830 [Patescibacteria group bacterium]|jgi:hypothetical protein
MKCKCGSEGFEINEDSEIQCSKCGEILMGKCSVCGEFHFIPISEYCPTTGKNIKLVQEFDKMEHEINQKIWTPAFTAGALGMTGALMAGIGGTGFFLHNLSRIHITVLLVMGIGLISYSIWFVRKYWLVDRYIQEKFPQLWQKKTELGKEIERTKKK